MKARWPEILGVFIFAFLATTPLIAYPYCVELACMVPPQHYCDELCWECIASNSGTEYPGDPGYCDNPTLITVGDISCPCLQRCAAVDEPGAAPELDLFTVAVSEPEEAAATPGLGADGTPVRGPEAPN